MGIETKFTFKISSAFQILLICGLSLLINLNEFLSEMNFPKHFSEEPYACAVSIKLIGKL